MKHLNTKTGVVLLALVLLVPTLSGAQAEEKITVENGTIRIEGNDGEKMIMIDADHLHDFIASTLQETMEGMDEVLDELDHMQLEIRLGEDNQLSIETEDQMWELNLDLMFRELGVALETAFDDFDPDTFTSHEHWDEDSLEDEDLADELARLKAELRRLKKELEHLKEI